MVLTSLEGLSDTQKEDLVASLSGLIVGTTDEVSAEKLQAVATASGNSLSAPLAALFAKVITSAEKGVESYTPGPGGGGGGTFSLMSLWKLCVHFRFLNFSFVFP